MNQAGVLFSWRDSGPDSQLPGGLRQLNAAGEEIEAPIEIGYQAAQLGWSLHCLDQKVAIAGPSALMTLECQAE